MHTGKCGKNCWSLIGGVMAVAALLCSPMAAANPAAAKLSPAEVQAIAEEGFIYGLPMVMDYAVMYDFVINRDSPAWKAPFNTLRNEARVFTSADTTVVTPNSDTPYSLVWADLRAEPIVITVPQVDPKRYYGVMMVDNNTFNYATIGTRTTGNGPGNFMVVGPKWQGETPAGIKQVFRSSTETSTDPVPDAALQSAGHAERREGAGRLPGTDAVGVHRQSRRRPQRRRSTGRRSIRS